MRHILAALLLLAPAIASAQTGLVNAWHLDYSGTMDPMGATFSISFDQAVAASITADTGQALTVASTPVKVADGTWPAGLSGSQGSAWYFDGANTYLTSTIDPPAGDFSVACIVTPLDVAAADHHLIGNDNPTGNLRGWSFGWWGTLAFLSVSDDGTSAAGHLTTVAKDGLAVNRRSFVAASYDYVSDGGSTINLWVDGLTVATSAVADGPVFASADYLGIGARGDASADAKMFAHECRTWARALSAAEVSRLRAMWLGIGDSGATAGNDVAVTSAAPPALMVATAASGTEPFLVEQPVNSGRVGMAGLYGAAALTNLAQRGSFETCVAGHPTGWTIIETAGDGTAAVDCDTTTRAHGQTSVKMVLTGTTSYGYVFGTCYTTGIGGDVYISIYAKKSAGTADATVALWEYDADNCSGLLAADSIYSGDLTTSWAQYGAKMATASWNAATSSYQIVAVEAGNGGVTSYFDAVQVRVASTPTDTICVTDADASAVCNAVIASVPTKVTAGSWTVEGTWQCPADGADTGTKTLLQVPPTAGDNNRVTISHASDTLTCVVTDSAGNAKTSTVAAASDANAAWDFRCEHSPDGTVWACAKLHTDAAWTCDATPATAALMVTPSTTTYLGSDGTTGSNCWVDQVKVYRRVR
jgi:hypothetical protein